MTERKTMPALTRHLLLVLVGAVMAFPFYWMVTSGLKTNDEIWQFPPTFWPDAPKWGNFLEAWE
ncbi:carbohydrate ABC transporter permease, partial [Paenibacillus sepulcri]|nr:carbohydrate ABC transporter permease [Paenibacillus sepulcri]